MEIFKIIVISILILETLIVTILGLRTIIKIDKSIKKDEEELEKLREKIKNV